VDGGKEEKREAPSDTYTTTIEAHPFNYCKTKQVENNNDDSRNSK
jgi:hypothetical protein